MYTFTVSFSKDAILSKIKFLNYLMIRAGFQLFSQLLLLAVNKISLLNQDQIANPSQVVTDFYDKYPIAYIVRVLNDWLEAGISYPDSMSELQALHTYRSVLYVCQSINKTLG